MTTLRQSDIKLWLKCPLAWRFANVEKLPRLQGGALTYGSILHDCVFHLETTRDLDAAIERFERFWREPTLLDPSYGVEYYHRGASWVKYATEGPEVLRHWAKIIEWDSELVLAREYTFDLPIGRNGHRLRGTLDKLVIAFHPKTGAYVVKVVDYKTDRKTPKYDFLEEDLQFSAYCWATTQREFWEGLPGGRGPELFEQYKHLPRRGEWVQLTGPRIMDAGERVDRHYRRLSTAVDAISDSIAMGIYVPTISGETCRYCDYRGPCGLPEIEEDETPRY